MPRIKASPKKCIKTNVQQPTNSWIFLLKGEALELSEQYTGTGTPDIVTLRHPNTGESAVFLFSPANNSVQEILTLSDNKRSWFIDEMTKSDGKMHLSTPIDPIFLVLPYLRKYCTMQAIPLDQLLRDDDFPETERLLKSSGLKYLSMIADRKGDEELNAFKYNEDKTLSWLKKKTERVAEILKQKNIHVGTGAVSATYVKATTKSESINDNNESYLRYAHGIVSEYLMDDLSIKLLKYLNLTPEDGNIQHHQQQQQQQQLQQLQSQQMTTTLKRKSSSNNALIQQQQNDMKKIKLDDDCSKNTNSMISNSNALDLSKPEPKSKLLMNTTMQNSKDKARSKAASGSKNITSFFKKT